MHENENSCEGHFGIGCWIDWLELTIYIFAVGIPHLMEEPAEKVKLVFPKLHEGEVIEREAVVCEQFETSEDEYGK